VSFHFQLLKFSLFFFASSFKETLNTRDIAQWKGRVCEVKDFFLECFFHKKRERKKREKKFVTASFYLTTTPSFSRKRSASPISLSRHHTNSLIFSQLIQLFISLLLSFFFSSFSFFFFLFLLSFFFFLFLFLFFFLFLFPFSFSFFLFFLLGAKNLSFATPFTLNFSENLYCLHVLLPFLLHLPSPICRSTQSFFFSLVVFYLCSPLNPSLFFCLHCSSR